ncbi:MAG: pyridoxamine 5'-phosphate oxidase family protein [Hyphomicrobiales bacterium]|nr:pyridoxamine 5'-phosphate oxidase family protein [Hyphomicrobiales bacterium]
MLTDKMKKLITDHRAGMVASINDDGTPSVSPKATFVILDERKIAFGNIRSPGTLANIRQRPAVEVCFIDVVLRKAVRVTGTAAIHPKATAEGPLAAAFEAEWSAYLPHISTFVTIDVSGAELIVSPAYDIGLTEDELRRTNLEMLNTR